ncbi:uncharacterized protein LOC106461429 [Limulus polyphemus]|uniref:Uncharacterized protein LOC106461429 n=1 Tax=Limulus polyphemus TaxID=6850 RepID=A0ABM1B822_LIMPO|nr:uncharacterized protein LOC106461429 [Limulus polyphemus]
MILLWLTLFFIKELHGLRLLDLEVPSVVESGDPVWLNCSFDLEHDDLYSVKWYKNSVEFYRYLPKEEPRAHQYELPGVYIDLERSGENYVSLSQTDLDSEGTYRCEVSAEAPSFQTERAERELKTYELPKEDPVMEGIQDSYSPGDVVDVTCVAAPSKPAAVLKWFINDKETPKNYQKPLLPITKEKLFGSKLALTFVVKQTHQWNNPTHIRCTSVIVQEYSQSIEELFIRDIKSTELRAAKDGPQISGLKSNYELGDKVNANCSLPKVVSPPILRWYVNKEEVMPDQLDQYQTIECKDGYKTALLGLHFTITEKHFRNGEMRLNCTATFSKVIDRRDVDAVIGTNQQSSGLQLSEKKTKGTNGSVVLYKLPWRFLSHIFIISLILQ